MDSGLGFTESRTESAMGKIMNGTSEMAVGKLINGTSETAVGKLINGTAETAEKMVNETVKSASKKISRLEQKISIPEYTLGEELISAISHGLGAVFGIYALTACVAISTMHGNTRGIVSSWIYGASIIILYLMSCLYHSLTPCNGKRVMRIFDHCTIFLLIAGSYTPFTLVSLNGAVGWTMFGVVWGAAVVGIILNAIDMERFKGISMFCYIAMGWVIVLAFKYLAKAVPAPGIKLLVAGGVVYTVGAVIFGIGGKVKYMHSLWHFFVLGGTILQFLCVYLYVL